MIPLKMPNLAMLKKGNIYFLDPHLNQNLNGLIPSQDPSLQSSLVEIDDVVFVQSC